VDILREIERLWELPFSLRNDILIAPEVAELMYKHFLARDPSCADANSMEDAALAKLLESTCPPRALRPVPSIDLPFFRLLESPSARSISLIGSSGHGKSSLLSALFGSHSRSLLPTSVDLLQPNTNDLRSYSFLSFQYCDFNSLRSPCISQPVIRRP
jgi:hypothetical protein